jgi:hypothetical protein
MQSFDGLYQFLGIKDGEKSIYSFAKGHRFGWVRKKDKIFGSSELY